MDLSSAFGINEKALQVRSQRLEVLSRNIANADTPNYKAQDLDFKAMLKEVKILIEEFYVTLCHVSDSQCSNQTEPFYDTKKTTKRQISQR